LFDKYEGRAQKFYKLYNGQCGRSKSLYIVEEHYLILLLAVGRNSFMLVEMYGIKRAFFFLSLFSIPIFAAVTQHSRRQATSAYPVGNGRRLIGSSFDLLGNQTYDYVVVGGGTAGLAISSRLAQAGHSVAVIEAGSFYELGNSNMSQIPLFSPIGNGKSMADTNAVDWQFQTQPQTAMFGVKAHYARGKCLGGSSARHFMTYHLPTKGVLQKWADQTGDNAYTWDNFVPYYQKSQNFMGPQGRPANATPQYDASTLKSGGPLTVTYSPWAFPFASWALKAWAAMGIVPIKGLTSGNLLGSAYQLLTISNTYIRESSETAFLVKVGIPSGNLIVYPSTMAQKIVFSGTKATGVVITIDNFPIPFTLSAKKEVIVSAGAFQSPQLLMVSGVGPQATLQKYGIPVVKDLPGVGQGMEDHILGGPSYKVSVTTTSSLFTNPAFAAQQVQSYLTSNTGMLTGVGADALSWELLPKNLTSAMPASAQADLASLPADWPHIELFSTSAYYGYQNNYATDAPLDGQYASIAGALAAPFSRGTITISSGSMNDPPIIDPGWLTHPTDQAVAVAAFKRARDTWSNMKAISIGSEAFPGPNVQSDADILKIVLQSFGTVFHASCTCRMGNSSDSLAVVDSHARVFGISGLRVVDASSFALLPPGHPQATVYALAEKIAANIIAGQ
jgi:choline dehydrogenase